MTNLVTRMQQEADSHLPNWNTNAVALLREGATEILKLAQELRESLIEIERLEGELRVSNALNEEHCSQDYELGRLLVIEAAAKEVRVAVAVEASHLHTDWFESLAKMVSALDSKALEPKPDLTDEALTAKLRQLPAPPLPSVEELREPVPADEPSASQANPKGNLNYWQYMHFWGQDTEYKWIQSCPCARCVQEYQRRLEEQRRASEPKPQARDAEHCDYPDCEQHWTHVVAQARALLEPLADCDPVIRQWLKTPDLPRLPECGQRTKP